MYNIGVEAESFTNQKKTELEGKKNPPYLFQPGNKFAVGHGRPKGTTTLSQVLKRLAGEIDPDTGKTNLELIAEALIRKARKGDSKSTEIFRDTSEGKPVERIRVSKGPDESNITDQEIDAEIKRLANGTGEGENPAPPGPAALPGAE